MPNDLQQSELVNALRAEIAALEAEQHESDHQLFLARWQITRLKKWIRQTGGPPLPRIEPKERG